VLDIPHNERVMSPPPEKLKSIPIKIMETSGLQKTEALLGAIRGKWVDILIIDEELAKAISDRL